MTRKIGPIALSLAMVLIVPAPGSSQAPNLASDMAAINQVLATLMSAYAKRDLDTINRLMANELKAYGSNFNAASLDEFQRKASGPLAEVRAAQIVGKQDVTLSGNLAYVAFMTDVQRETASGMQQTRLRWTVVLQRAKDRWAIVHYHLSPDPEATFAR